MMDGRYEVFASHGKGVFSTVLRARDKTKRLDDGNFQEVAIKMIRSNDTMFAAGQTEKRILNKLSGCDPTGKMHCIRLLRTFEYRSHLCLVFESLVNPRLLSALPAVPAPAFLLQLSLKTFRDSINLPCHMVSWVLCVTLQRLFAVLLTSIKKITCLTSGLHAH